MSVSEGKGVGGLGGGAGEGLLEKEGRQREEGEEGLSQAAHEGESQSRRPALMPGSLRANRTDRTVSKALTAATSGAGPRAEDDKAARSCTASFLSSSSSSFAFSSYFSLEKVPRLGLHKLRERERARVVPTEKHSSPQ